MRKNTLREILISICIYIYVVFLVCLHFVRIFDCNFGGDEAFSIRLAKMDFFSIIEATAADVHPPLYYAILQFFCRIFGYSGEVYHAVSLLPYVLLALILFTVVKKWFEIEVSVVMLTITSLHEDSIIRITEPRMYSWGALFVFLSFLALYKMLTENTKKSWVYFSVFTLCAAYTHYFTLVSVAFFYAVLILYSFKKKEIRKRTAAVCGTAVIVYLPWLFVLIQTFNRTVDEFWLLYIPYIWECFEYIFSGKLALPLCGLWMLLLIYAVFYNRKSMDKIVWVLAGPIAIVGTMAVGNIVSKLFRPVFLVRYLYPVVILAWFLLAVAISYCKRKKIYSAIIVAAILAFSMPYYFEVYEKEKIDNEQVLLTLEVMEEANHENAVILTDLKHVAWTIAECYWPKAESSLAKEGSDWLNLSSDKEYWCLLGTEIDEDAVKILSEQGYECVLLQEGAGLSDFDILIYKLERDR